VDALGYLNPSFRSVHESFFHGCHPFADGGCISNAIAVYYDHVRPYEVNTILEKKHAMGNMNPARAFPEASLRGKRE
jgi:hypothetical protein